MDTVNKQFPEHQQAVESNDCGPICLQNIYEYYGINKDLPIIFQELGIKESSITHLPQLASYLKKSGFETIILNSNPGNFAPEWGNKPKDEVINLMKKWVTRNSGDFWLRDSLYLLFYLQEGGLLKQVDLSTGIIDRYLSNNYLILVCVNETWIWGKRKISGVVKFDSVLGRANGHFVVIYGQNKNDYLISDPYPTGLPNKEKSYKVPKDKMLVSILVWAAEILALKKELK